MDSAFNNILLFKWLQWNGMAQRAWHSVFKSMPQFIQEPLLHYVPNWVSSVQLLSIQRLRNWVSSPERCQPRVIRRVSKREGWKNTRVLNLPPSCADTAMSGHILILNITVEKVFWHPCQKNKNPSVFLNSTSPVQPITFLHAKQCITGQVINCVIFSISPRTACWWKGDLRSPQLHSLREKIGHLTLPGSIWFQLVDDGQSGLYLFGHVWVQGLDWILVSIPITILHLIVHAKCFDEHSCCLFASPAACQASPAEWHRFPL